MACCLTDLRGGWYSHLRTQSADGGCVCHYVSTRRGLGLRGYCARGPGLQNVVGLYDPETHSSHEIGLPQDWGYTHTGADAEGRLWFYETQPNHETTP